MNRFLIGNGEWCSACGGSGRGAPRDRIEYTGGAYCQFYDRCPSCGGQKRVAFSANEVATARAPVVIAAPRTLLDQTMEWGR